MLARAQWQTSRQRLAYVCPACRVAIAQRHYTQPGEPPHRSGHGNANVLGSSKTPKSMSNEGHLHAILKQINQLSRSPADRKRLKRAASEGDRKDGDSSKRVERKQPKEEATENTADAAKQRSRKRPPQEQNKRSDGSEVEEQAHTSQKKAIKRREKDPPSTGRKAPLPTSSNHEDAVIARPRRASKGKRRRSIVRHPSSLSTKESPASAPILRIASQFRIRKLSSFRIRKLRSSHGISAQVQSSRLRRKAALSKHLSNRASLRNQSRAELKGRATAKTATGLEQREQTKETHAENTPNFPGRSLKQALSVGAFHIQNDKQEMSSARKQLKFKKAKNATMEVKATQDKIEVVNAAQVDVLPLDVPRPPVPSLSYGLDRVLFNPGVYHLQDPRSRVYNFDPYLEKIIPAVEFNFSALNPFVTPSRDQVLHRAAHARNMKYYSSTSTMTESLKHFHYLISQWRELNLSMLSKGFQAPGTSFTQIQLAPTSAFLRYQGGRYAIEADKSYDKETMLSLVGRSMEKLLTLPKASFEQYRRSNPGEVPEELASREEAYHYTVFDKILVRSQLDAYDPRIPGTGMFDIKTRVVLPIRMDIGSRGGVVTSYQIKDRLGTYESFEREYFDMIRATMLKYSMQVRLGRMDGLFVAYHNIERIFGFQYISLEDMDLALHGQKDRTLGDQEMNASLRILGDVFDRAVKRFPEQSIRLHFETRQKKAPFMYIFAEPISEEELRRLDDATRKRRKEMAEAILNPDPSKTVGTSEELVFDEGWNDLKNMVREEVSSDDTEQESEAHEHENEPKPLSDHEAIAKLENRIAELRVSIDLLKEKTLWLKRNSDSGNDFDTLPIVTASIGNERQFVEIIKETEELDRALKALQSAHDLHQTEDEGLQQRIDAMPQQFKAMELQLSRQMTANGRMMNTLGEVTDERSKNEESREKEATTSDTADRDSVESPAAQFESEASKPNSSEMTIEVSPVQNPAESTTQTVASRSAQESSGETSEPSSEDTQDAFSEFDSSPSELLAFTLSIRNRVNNEYVTRPENLTSSDNWTVEYSLEEFSDEEEAVSRYKDLRRRKWNAFSKTTDEAKIDWWYNSWFMQQMYDVSEKGRKWREEMDRVDERVGVRVFVPSEEASGAKALHEHGHDNGGDRTVLKRLVGGKTKDVDGYLQWLYKEWTL